MGLSKVWTATNGGYVEMLEEAFTQITCTRDNFIKGEGLDLKFKSI